MRRPDKRALDRGLGRKMRSKNSMIHGILQFTLSIAFRYVLHRNESRDIRCRESLHHVLHPLANQCDPCNKCPGPWRTRHHCTIPRPHIRAKGKTPENRQG